MLIECFLENLNDYMDLKNLGNADISRITGIDKGVISHWLTGRSKPGLEKIELVANSIGIEPYKMLIKSYVKTNSVSLENDYISFENFINQLAEKALSERELMIFKNDGGPNAFLRYMIQNRETSTYNQSDWFYYLHEAFRYFSEYDMKAAADEINKKIKERKVKPDVG